MKIKYSPINSTTNTSILIIDDNTLSIDNELYEFDIKSILFPDIWEQTDGAILEAYRDESNELCVTVRRFYTDSCIDWDTGEYHEINR